jgi:hypothetical protein
MLHRLLLKKMAISALGDNLHRVILSYRTVESILEGFDDD